MVLDYRVVGEEVFLTGTFGRHKFMPWGLNGGHDGLPNGISVIRKDGRVEGPFAKVARLRLAKGDVARLVNATGERYRDPRRRPPAKVASDQRDGYITAEKAIRFYGAHADAKTERA